MRLEVGSLLVTSFRSGDERRRYAVEQTYFFPYNQLLDTIVAGATTGPSLNCNADIVETAQLIFKSALSKASS